MLPFGAGLHPRRFPIVNVAVIALRTADLGRYHAEPTRFARHGESILRRATLLESEAPLP